MGRIFKSYKEIVDYVQSYSGTPILYFTKVYPKTTYLNGSTDSRNYGLSYLSMSPRQVRVIFFKDKVNTIGFESCEDGKKLLTVSEYETQSLNLDHCCFSTDYEDCAALWNLFVYREIQKVKNLSNKIDLKLEKLNKII